MIDKELLELAAKAAGVECKKTPIGFYLLDEDRNWNPLTDDGDALRLAVKLGLKTSVGYDIGLVFCRPSESNENEVWEPLGKNDPYAATRRAITRAAAEIGKAMP
jgi:hypothetical protein